MYPQTETVQVLATFFFFQATGRLPPSFQRANNVSKVEGKNHQGPLVTYIQNMACPGETVFVSNQVIVYYVSFLIQKEKKKLYCLVNTLEKRVTHLPLLPLSPAVSSQL